MKVKELAERYPRLTLEQEQQLGRLSLAGSIEARNRLVMHNLRLVTKIVPSYKPTYQNWDDLVEAGCLGLIRAAEKFDPDKGCRFSTYAHNWIKQAIRRHLNRDALMPVPQATIENLKSKETLSRTNLQTLTAIRLSKQTMSMDMPIPGTDGLVLGNIISDGFDEWQSVEHAELRASVAKLCEEAKLSELDKQVLACQFGFNTEPMTVEKTAQYLGLTFNQVRVIRRKAMYQLRKIATEEYKVA